MKLNLRNAITSGFRHCLSDDESVILLGMDVGRVGGVFGATRGLQEEFGSERVRDTPISEGAITGAAIGAAASGLRPIVEVQFADFLLLAADQLINNAAKWRELHGGRSLPMVVFTASGGGMRVGMHHSQTFDSTFANVPGLEVVCPSDALSAQRLLIDAVHSDNPTIFMAPKSLFGSRTLLAEHDPDTPLLGSIRTLRTGGDVTIVAAGAATHLAVGAANELADEGVTCDVLDLVTISPLDTATLFASVGRTGRLVVVHDSWGAWGLGSELLARCAEENVLTGGAARVTARPQAYPTGVGEDAVRPRQQQVVDTVHRLLDS